jgi:hypothetical protein
MAELTKLENKLAEVLGLAMAAKGATTKVKGLAKDESELVSSLDRMGEEAAETERRCEELAGSFDGKKTAIVEQARETKQEATETRLQIGRRGCTCGAFSGSRRPGRVLAVSPPVN